MADPSGVPPAVVTQLRSVCLGLPEAYEEQAWVGTRWRVREQTFADVLVVDAGWPPAYTRAAATDGPATLITFRSEVTELLTDSYCLQAPKALAGLVDRPGD